MVKLDDGRIVIAMDAEDNWERREFLDEYLDTGSEFAFEDEGGRIRSVKSEYYVNKVTKDGDIVIDVNVMKLKDIYVGNDEKLLKALEPLKYAGLKLKKNWSDESWMLVAWLDED